MSERRLTVEERAIAATVYGSRWLADGNAASEAGQHDKAAHCYAKSQFWLDRYNLLSGCSDRAPPRK